MNDEPLNSRGMMKMEVDQLIKCAHCNNPIALAVVGLVNGKPTVLCPSCSDNITIKISYKSENPPGSTYIDRIWQNQTVNDIRWSTGLTPHLSHSGAPDPVLILERTGTELPGDSTLEDAGVQDGDVLIVRVPG